MKNKKTFYYFLFIVLIIIVIELVKYFSIFPSHRFAQIYWHITNQSTIETENIKLELPIKWILAKETSSQYILHGDYVYKDVLKVIIIQKKAISEEIIKSGIDERCLTEYKVYEENNINDNFFKLYGCSKLKEGGSMAIISDNYYNFNMIVYDYKISDKEHIVELLEGLTLKKTISP